jgi:hypothetical protein
VCLIEPLMTFTRCAISNPDLKLSPLLLNLKPTVAFSTLVYVLVILPPLLFPVSNVCQKGCFQFLICHVLYTLSEYICVQRSLLAVFNNLLRALLRSRAIYGFLSDLDNSECAIGVFLDNRLLLLLRFFLEVLGRKLDSLGCMQETLFERGWFSAQS